MNSSGFKFVVVGGSAITFFLLSRNNVLLIERETSFVFDVACLQYVAGGVVHREKKKKIISYVQTYITRELTLLIFIIHFPKLKLLRFYFAYLYPLFFHIQKFTTLSAIGILFA